MKNQQLPYYLKKEIKELLIKFKCDELFNLDSRIKLKIIEHLEWIFPLITDTEIFLVREFINLKTNKN